ncbi:MAG: tRNA dihydrouridine synthase DusB [Treponema sp.]|nr:tRNA dihydrouridine synthase DusB [Treponema sp.]
MLYHPVSIGSLSLNGNLFLAPVAGYSDRAFRHVCVIGGADFAYTEMVSAEALTRGNEKTKDLMLRAPNEKAYAVQLFGGTGDVVSRAATIVLASTTAECIDINAGCPVPKIVKTGAGSSLTRDPDRLYDLLHAVVKAVSSYDGTRPCYEDGTKPKCTVPVTVKIRSGWDAQHITWKEAAQAALEAGVSAITLHGRTRAQGYEGKADWGLLKELVDFVAGRIPVFGSGDVFTPEAAKDMLEQTGCDGVMFARGAMGHPFIFRQTRQLLTEGFYEEISERERLQAGFDELEILVKDRGENNACREMRKRFCSYSKGIPGGAELRRQIITASSVEDYKHIFFN